LVASVIEAMEASGLPASRLELEITESVLLADNESSLATLRQLHELGTQIALDDFGTGYSSLSYLRSFPFDKIKIDQSFVRDLDTEQDSRTIVRAIMSLAHSLGMETLAEGVETAKQFEWLREEGCGAVQGYFFGRPTRCADVQALIETLGEDLRAMSYRAAIQDVG
jgi:EAL domain-containing protein (putative c-di-GMP-specific phosphodiesterase class I)